eukprot:6195644-Pleurochrysis_carterae.AAC.1
MTFPSEDGPYSLVCFLPLSSVKEVFVDPPAKSLDLNFTLSDGAACDTATAARKPAALHAAYMAAVRKQSATVPIPPAKSVDLTVEPTNVQSLRPRRQSAEGEHQTTTRRTEDIADDAAKPKTSGIPKGLAFWGESKLETRTEEQLLLALTENGMEQPPADESDNSGWAKNALLR